MSDHKVILGDLRAHYGKDGLREADADPDPLVQFDRWLEEALQAEIPEPNAMTLATSDLDGQPSARTVLLKGLDSAGFSFFTNYHSRKARDLEANPKAALVFLWRELERQVLVRGTVTRTTEEESRAYHETRPRGSQIGAWVSEHQTSEIPDCDFMAQREAELLEQWPEGTPVPLPPFWGGYCLRPDYLEFWQGRPSRLHDRLAYTRDGERWQRARLSP
jgi:pyridoxamine 5'-phosphate oxidase